MRARDERGFSLIEVVVALGLLAGVLISIAGLFVLGGKQVKSGRTATEALSVARGILEEMDGWGFRQTYELYGFDGSTAAVTADTRTNAYALRWQPILNDKLVNSYALIQVQSLVQTGAPPPLSTTRTMRVLVTVHWDEGARHRTSQLGTVRM
jgi:type II secretory pathway pseudopilin PulG